MAEENKESIFRKSSLERISSPEQLNEYIKVTSLNLIVILLAILSMVIGGLVWIFTFDLSESVNLVGVSATSYMSEQKIYCYAPISTASQLKKGMAVQIEPTYAPRETYGYNLGTITKIGTEIITSEYLNGNFYNPSILSPALASSGISLLSSTMMNSADNCVEIEIDTGTWSNDVGTTVQITEGATCKLTIIVKNQKPWELIFGNVKTQFENIKQKL